jgi:hypothetical protein
MRSLIHPELVLAKKHQKTPTAIFSEPTRANIRWNDVVALFTNLGAAIAEREGSRVHVQLHGEEAVFHRPHPRNELSKPAVRSLREFLENAGVVP